MSSSLIGRVRWAAVAVGVAVAALSLGGGVSVASATTTSRDMSPDASPTMSVTTILSSPDGIRIWSSDGINW